MKPETSDTLTNRVDSFGKSCYDHCSLEPASPPVKTARPRLLYWAFATSLILNSNPGWTQFAYEGWRQDVGYKVFIYAKESLGPGKWRFQTKSVFSKGEKPYYSDWRVADCYDSTLDGLIVPAIARSGAEEGQPEVLRAVCGYK